MSFSISLSAHAALIVLAMSLAPKLMQPGFSMRSGAGGDGIEIAEPDIMSDIFTARATQSQLSAPPQSNAAPREDLAELVVASALPGDGLLTLPQAETPAIQLGAVDSTVQYPNFASSQSAEPGEGSDARSGGGGMGGDGFASSAPVPAARNRPPRYPAEAQRRGIEGTVVLNVRVLASGHVENVAVVQSSGSELLDAAAVDAVQDWEFNSATDGHAKIACHIKLPFEFSLHRR